MIIALQRTQLIVRYLQNVILLKKRGITLRNALID